MTSTTPTKSTTTWRPWRFVLWFGVASMLADMAYEGARSITGPYLASLGVSAGVVGLVSGVSEALSLTGRLASGPLADKTRAHWGLAIGGYALTAISVPLMGLTSVVWIVIGLVFAERAGKALRRPAKDVMLSHATSAIGRGKGFAVHESLDQFGAVVGPLAVAAVFAATGHYAPAFAILAIPGLGVIVLLVWLRRRVPDASVFEPTVPAPAALPTADGEAGGGALASLGRPYWEYVAFATLAGLGLSTFVLFGFHLNHEGLASPATVSIIYAAAMGVAGLAALAVGTLFDRVGRKMLVVVPILAVAVPPLGFSDHMGTVIAGVMVWAVILGIQESVMRAAIADMVPVRRRGTAYGIFATALGLAALGGATISGQLYLHSLPLLVALVATVEAAALVVYVIWSRRQYAAVA